MVCWAQQFEFLTDYAYRLVRRRKWKVTIDVEQSCNHALLQWLEYEGEEKAQAMLAENGLADPPPLLKRMVRCRLFDKVRAEALHPISACDAEWLDRITAPDERDPDIDSNEGDELHQVGDRDRQKSAMRDRLEDYISRRSPETRDLLYMRLVADMPASEVAENLRISDNAIHCAVYRLTSFMKKGFQSG